jgi:RNA-binding protein 5/10
MSPQLHPAGFRINDKPIAASFAHPFSFQPLGEHALRDDTCVASSNSLGGGEGFWVKYWDDGTSVAEMAFEVEEPEFEVVGAMKTKKKKEQRGFSTF